MSSQNRKRVILESAGNAKLYIYISYREAKTEEKK
jgi:hypothetical protein